MLNETRYSLARIPLRWMIRECFKTKTGIIFDAYMLKYELGLNIGPSPTFKALEEQHLPLTCQLAKKPEGPSWLSSAYQRIQKALSFLLDQESEKPIKVIGSESEEEFNDALSLIYDQLEAGGYWRVIEMIPCKLSSSPESFAPSNNEFIRCLIRDREVPRRSGPFRWFLDRYGRQLEPRKRPDSRCRPEDP